MYKIINCYGRGDKLLTSAGVEFQLSDVSDNYNTFQFYGVNTKKHFVAGCSSLAIPKQSTFSGDTVDFADIPVMGRRTNTSIFLGASGSINVYQIWGINSPKGTVFENQRNFVLHADNANPSGIVISNGFAYIGNAATNKIFVYELQDDGAVRAAEKDVSLEETRSINDIDINSSKLYVLGQLQSDNSRWVEIYDLTDDGGTRNNSESFQVNYGSVNGIAVRGDFAYLTRLEGTFDDIYCFQLSTKSRVVARDVEVNRGAASGRRWNNMQFVDDSLYAGRASSTFVRYDITNFSDGSYRFGETFGLTSLNRDPAGLSIYQGRVYVLDRVDKKVYVQDL